MKAIHRITITLGAFCTLFAGQSALAGEQTFYTTVVANSAPSSWNIGWTNVGGAANSNCVAGNLYSTYWNGVNIGGNGQPGNFGFTVIRTPKPDANTSVFPGDSLMVAPGTVLAFTIYTTGAAQSGYAGTTFSGSPPTKYVIPTNVFNGVTNANFPTGVPGLQLDGGGICMLNNGDATAIAGTIYAVPGTTSYLLCSGDALGYPNGTDVNQGLILAGTLSGSGTLVVLEGTNSNPQQVTGLNNSGFTGTWIVQAGWLQGIGDGTQDGYNALSTNANFKVDPLWPIPYQTTAIPGFTNVTTGSEPNFIPTNVDLLDLGASLMNSAGTLILTNNGRMWLHGHYVFSAVTINGTVLTNGYYSYGTLTNAFPSNFTSLPFISSYGGDITVQPSGPAPGYSPLISPEPPAGQTNLATSTAQIATTVTGLQPISLLWYTVDNTGTNFTGAVTGSNIFVAANGTLSISNLALGNATNYVLVASNSLGVVTSTVVTLTVDPAPGPGTNITFNYGGNPIVEGGGDWTTLGDWYDGNNDGGLSAVTLLADLPGLQSGANAFELVDGSVMRTPSGATSTNFPGSLVVDGYGTYIPVNTGGTATTGNSNATFICKGGPNSSSGSRAELWITNLTLNGGTMAMGNEGVCVLDGSMEVNSNTPIGDINTTTDDRGWQIDAVVSGAGSIQVELESQAGYQSTYTNSVWLTNNNNTFTGTWIITQGALVGGGNNSLGTNSILVASNGMLETMYNINDPNATLTLNSGSVVLLHQNDLFSNVLFGSLTLPSGTYTSTLLQEYGSSLGVSFPSTWPQKLGSTVSNISGSITVTGTNGNPPYIVAEPQPEEIYVGNNASFSVTAGGQPSGMTYTWQYVGVGLPQSVATNVVGGSAPLANATVTVNGTLTGSTLTLAGITTNENYDFYVVVANGYGTAISSPAATLTVVSPTDPYETNLLAVGSSNLVAYWRLNETAPPVTTAYDYVGGFNGFYGAHAFNGSSGTLGPNPTSSPPAGGFPNFEFTNYCLQTFLSQTDSFVQVPALNVDTNNLSILAWINPQNTVAADAGVFYCRAGTTVAGLSYNNLATSLAYTWNNVPQTYNWNSGILPPQNVWSLAALVVTPSNATLTVINGNGLQTAVNNVSNAVQNFDGVSLIGADGLSPQTRAFAGMIDEVAVIKGALSLSQVVDLYNEAAGIVASSPVIEENPVTTSNYVGQAVQFDVVIAGSSSNLTYTWQYTTTGSPGPYTNVLGGPLTPNASVVSSATGSTLTLTNINPSNALDFVVVVSNSFGSVNTYASPATLLVLETFPATTNYFDYPGPAIGGTPIVEGNNGEDWNTPGNWFDGNADGGMPASVLAVEYPGSTYVLPDGAVMRTPQGAPETNFPGPILMVDGYGTYVPVNTGGTATTGNSNATLICKGGPGLSPSNRAEIFFTNLVMNGGTLAMGAEGVAVLDGSMEVNSNTPIGDINNTVDDRGWQIDALVSGAGSIQVVLESQQGYQAAYTNSVWLVNNNNTFTGAWYIQEGPLVGGGMNSLGTNSIDIGSAGALETMYNLYDPGASLTIASGGAVYLHQNDTFQTVTVNGATLYAGTYSAATLNSAFPATFPLTWTQKLGSTVSSASGSITVLQPPPPQLNLNFAAQPFTLTWTNGTLMQATNLLGPWLPNTNTSPYVVEMTNGQMFFRLTAPLLP